MGYLFRGFRPSLQLSHSGSSAACSSEKSIVGKGDLAQFTVVNMVQFTPKRSTLTYHSRVACRFSVEKEMPRSVNFRAFIGAAGATRTRDPWLRRIKSHGKKGLCHKGNRDAPFRSCVIPVRSPLLQMTSVSRSLHGRHPWQAAPQDSRR